MKLSEKTAVIVTAAYSDIFGYPLTIEEFTQWLIGGRRLAPKTLSEHPLSIIQSDGQTFVTLKKGITPLRQRHRRETACIKKWRIVRRVAALFKLIPTIILVGVTGGLSMNNTRPEDDIDIVLITRRKTLWITRFLAVLTLEILGMRRRPVETAVENKICLNMLVSEEVLALPRHERDLYTAHEVLQMKPVWERDGTYLKFLQANRWVKQFLPNAWAARTQNPKFKMQNDNLKRKNVLLFKFYFVILPFTFYLLPFLEPLVRGLQLWYMQKRRTNEVITDTMIRFHPVDARSWVRRELARRLSPYNVPLDKIWSGRLK